MFNSRGFTFTTHELCRNWWFLCLIDFRQSLIPTKFIWCWCKHPQIKAYSQHFTSKSLFHFKTSVLEHWAKTTKNVSLSKYSPTALYFHPLYFIVLICLVLLCYSLQQRLHLPNICNSLGEYSLTNSVTNWIRCSTKDIVTEKDDYKFSVSWQILKATQPKLTGLGTHSC